MRKRITPPTPTPMISVDAVIRRIAQAERTAKKKKKLAAPFVCKSDLVEQVQTLIDCGPDEDHEDVSGWTSKELTDYLRRHDDPSVRSYDDEFDALATMPRDKPSGTITIGSVSRPEEAIYSPSAVANLPSEAFGGVVITVDMRREELADVCRLLRPGGQVSIVPNKQTLANKDQNAKRVSAIVQKSIVPENTVSVAALLAAVTPVAAPVEPAAAEPIVTLRPANNYATDGDVTTLSIPRRDGSQVQYLIDTDKLATARRHHWKIIGGLPASPVA